MDLSDATLLLVAGMAAGAVNAVAGGGSLITFPTLLAVGLPPISANVTNSVAVCPGYLASVVGSRAELRGQGRRLLRLAPTAVAGSAAGCALLLVTPARAFEIVVPFLVLGAAVALAFQERLRRLVGHPRELPPRRAAVTTHGVVFLGAVYGGYFGAALGVMLIAALALVLDETLARVGAAKNVISAVVGRVRRVRSGQLGRGRGGHAGEPGRRLRGGPGRPPPAGGGAARRGRHVRRDDRRVAARQGPMSDTVRGQGAPCPRTV
jgi:uncharacterized protein